MNPPETPSSHELRIIAEAFLEADPFSYSPVFFHDARHDFSARMQALFWRTWDERQYHDWTAPGGREIERRIGTCPLGYRYYRIGGCDVLDGRNPEFQRFVALFCKGILHVSDVVRMTKGHAVSRGMFRETGEHVMPELLHSLVAESLCLMLLLWVGDRFYRYDARLGTPDSFNIVASSDGREYALYDFESVADFSEYDSHMMLETCFLGFSPENPVFSEEEGWALSDENSIEFIRDYFREDSSEFADILHALRERYAGVDGERFFRAILREAFAKELMDQEVIERAYARMMGTIGSLMASAREKKLLSSFFALMPPTC